MSKPVRVLVVDDSAFYRKRIRQCLEKSPRIEVVGEAWNGEEASRLNRSLEPDLITMDVVMPVLDGIAAVRRIMRERPVPVVMFSSFTREGARATLDALEAGAVDFVPKVTSDNSEGETAGARLRDKVLGLVRTGDDEAPALAIEKASAPVAPPELLLIGASTGGPMAVQEVLAGLPADFSLPVLVAIHMPAAFTVTYAERLDALIPLRVREAFDGMPLRPGEVVIAPGGRQTLVERRGAALKVRVTEDEGLYRPSVDRLFSSAAKVTGERTLAIVLTGMGSDGTEGARRIHEAGGQVWAQDRDTSVVYGMPQSVVRAGVTDRELPLQAVADAVREVV
ncbi:MAG: chemotaxis response regulator protein-glutamate methylesterase [Gammaproteobacteria bacterium]|nr:MAG: chemotaxis response regulator protein-glutamate methylesterase [Gammaproteobacteria bacterium]